MMNQYDGLNYCRVEAKFISRIVAAHVVCLSDNANECAGAGD